MPRCSRCVADMVVRYFVLVDDDLYGGVPLRVCNVYVVYGHDGPRHMRAVDDSLWLMYAPPL